MVRHRQTSLARLIILFAAGLPALCPAAPASSPTRPAPASSPTRPAPADAPAYNPKLRPQIDKLREIILGTDPAAARAAAEELRGLGTGGPRRILLDTLREVLARDKVAIEKSAASMSDPAKLRHLEELIAKERSDARANLKVLDKGPPVDEAKAHFDKLLDLLGQANAVYQERAQIADALARRKTFLPMFREMAAATDGSFNQASESKLTAQAEKALGMTTDAVLALPELGAGPEPKDPAERQLWYYRVCRRIEEYNLSLDGVAGREELENLKLVNLYRECLGLLPFELDARLVQAARRHSKEMVDLKYFAHESPTASESTPYKRMANAGYEKGYSENIAVGSTSGEKTFWMWFGSPPHHKNMVNTASGSIGIGRWQNYWTQNMGGGKRLMLMTPAERDKVKILGTVLPPDVDPPAGKGKGR